MQDVKIRRAREGDLATIQQLGYELLEVERQGWDATLDPKWPFSEGGKAAYAKAIREKYVILAEVGGEVAGYLIGAVNRPAEDVARHEVTAQMNNIYVREKWRGAGVAQELFKEFDKYCKGEGVGRMSVTVNFKNERARGFYEEAGFETALVIMRREVK